MTRLLVPIYPGAGLGPFALGERLCDVLSYLQAHKRQFRSVDVHYGVEDAYACDISLSLSEHGLRLYFDPGTQRLRLAMVTDPTRLSLTCTEGFGLHGTWRDVTFERLYASFGPTSQVFPGGENEAGSSWELSGPVPVPGTEPRGGHQRTASETVSSSSSSSASSQLHASPRGLPALIYPGLAFYFGPGTAAPASPSSISPDAPLARLAVYPGAVAAPQEVWAAPAPGRGEHPVGVLPGKGLALRGEEGGLEGAVSEIRFGVSPQDVVALLGTPQHSVCLTREALIPAQAYVYPSHGLDLIFSSGVPRLERIVLHSALPGQDDFGLYAKCRWRLAKSSGAAGEGGPAASLPGGSLPDAARAAPVSETELCQRKAKKGAQGRGASKTPPRQTKHSPQDSQPDSPSAPKSSSSSSASSALQASLERLRLESASPPPGLTSEDGLADVERALGPGGPAAATRAGGGRGASTLRAYPGLVFEVLEGGHIASLTLFADE